MSYCLQLRYWNVSKYGTNSAWSLTPGHGTTVLGTVIDCTESLIIVMCYVSSFDLYYQTTGRICQYESSKCSRTELNEHVPFEWDQLFGHHINCTLLSGMLLIRGSIIIKVHSRNFAFPLNWVIIGPGNDFPLVQCLAIASTSAGLLLIWPYQSNISFDKKKMLDLNSSSA